MQSSPARVALVKIDRWDVFPFFFSYFWPTSRLDDSPSLSGKKSPLISNLYDLFPFGWRDKRGRVAISSFSSVSGTTEILQKWTGDQPSWAKKQTQFHGVRFRHSLRSLVGLIILPTLIVTVTAVFLLYFAILVACLVNCANISQSLMCSTRKPQNIHSLQSIIQTEADAAKIRRIEIFRYYIQYI